MNLFVDLSNPVFGPFQIGFSNGNPFLRLLLFRSQFFAGSDSLLLNITDGSGGLLQVGECYFLCIGRIMLRFDAGLKIRDQLQFRMDKKDSDWIFIVSRNC